MSKRSDCVMIEDLECEGATRQLIKVVNEDRTFKVLGTHRTEPNIFEAKNHCDLCDPQKKKYVPKVVVIPGTRTKACSSCLCTMSEVLAAATWEDCKKSERD